MQEFKVRCEEVPSAAECGIYQPMIPLSCVFVAPAFRPRDVATFNNEVVQGYLLACDAHAVHRHKQ